jgi:hypothetical protein
MADVDDAQNFTEKSLLGRPEITSVTIRGNGVEVRADFATMTSYTRSKIEGAQRYVHNHWKGVGFALIPSGDTNVLGLPDKTSPHLVPGPPPGGSGIF